MKEQHGLSAPPPPVKPRPPDPACLPQALVAVDRALVRHGLAHLLQAERLARVSVASSGRQARNWLRRRPFDVVLVDAAQAEALGEAVLQCESRRTVLVTPRDHAGGTPLPASACACGMLSETRDEAATIELLRSVARCAQAGFQSERCGECMLRRTWRRPPLPLSPREAEIFVRIGAGEGPQRIASELGLSVKTVECHREKIKHKLGLQDGEALRLAALRWREGYRLA